MKLNRIIFAATATTAAIAATVILTHPAHAATSDSAMSTGTNGDAMAALFGDPVIATGTGVSVKRSELDDVITSVKSAAEAQGQQIPQDRLLRYEAEALEQMIDIQLLDQNATAADKAAGQAKADKAMATLLQRAGSKEMLDMQLKAAGSSEAELSNKVSQEATAMAVLQRELGVTVSEADVQKFYTDHPQEFEEPEMVHVQHILLMTIDPQTREPLPDDVVKAKRKEADDVLAKARAGQDFSKLAEQYSDDTTTKDKGGDLPPFARATDDPRHAMLPEFEAAAFSLTNNQISDIVTTFYGYHIIKLIDKIPAKTLTLTDKIPSADTTVADAVKDGLVQQKTQELAPPYLKKLKTAANVKITDPDLNAAVESLSDTNAPANAPAAPQ